MAYAHTHKLMQAVVINEEKRIEFRYSHSLFLDVPSYSANILKNS